MDNLLPLRFRLLYFLSTVEKADVDQMMEGLRAEYGSEKQFTRDKFVDHALSMKANFVIDEAELSLTKDGALNIYYCINDEGRKLLKRYLPKSYAYESATL